ncbi:hypothetical protein [Streptomyces buecherae]|uniref:hypothetical protein n=1 Tax=Streptomyces buecherae TaxID=2763006 RepID=UPI001C27BF17|nr:hypothetical protein [Streptomyces buecherae]
MSASRTVQSAASRSPDGFEQVDRGQAGLAVDELESDFGASGQVEGVEVLGVGGVDDAV